jgi:hypothetical protein
LIETLSHEELLSWVKEASSDPRPHVLIVLSTKRNVRMGLLYESENAARVQAMTYQSFDPDLVRYETIRPATPEEMSRRTIRGNILFEEPFSLQADVAAPAPPTTVRRNTQWISRNKLILGILGAAVVIWSIALARHKPVVLIDGWWNRDYIQNACELTEKNRNMRCIRTPEEMAADERVRFVSAFQASPACKDVSIYTGFDDSPLKLPKDKNEKADKTDWSLSFNVETENGDIDYASSEWQIIDNKTLKRFGEGSLADMNQAASQVCTIITGSGGSVQ